MRTSRPQERFWPDPDRIVDPFGDWPEPARGGGPLAPEPGRPEPPAPGCPSAADLARLGADHEPALGAEGVDRVLGPWADSAPSEARLEAMAVAAFLVGEDSDAAPVDRELRDTRDRAVAAGLRAARRAPFAPWWIRGDAAEPALPLGTGRVAAPVRWRPLPDPIGGGPARDGDLVFARLVLVAGPTGPEARVVCGLRAPDPGAAALLADAAALPPGRSAEDTLRRWGHTLYRRLLERAWSTTILMPTP